MTSLAVLTNVRKTAEIFRVISWFFRHFPPRRFISGISSIYWSFMQLTTAARGLKISGKSPKFCYLLVFRLFFAIFPGKKNQTYKKTQSTFLFQKQSLDKYFTSENHYDNLSFLKPWFRNLRKKLFLIFRKLSFVLCLS